MALVDLKGRRFGKWRVISLVRPIVRRARWECVCQCGKRRVVSSNNLTRGYSRSCGCAGGKRINRRKLPHQRTHVAKTRANVRLDSYSADAQARVDWMERMALVGRLIAWKHSVRYASYT